MPIFPRRFQAQFDQAQKASPKRQDTGIASSRIGRRTRDSRMLEANCGTVWWKGGGSGWTAALHVKILGRWHSTPRATIMSILIRQPADMEIHEHIGLRRL